MGSVTILNEQGDSTLVWSDDNNEAIRAVIERKMAEGWSFFILKPRLGGLISPSKTTLKSFKDLSPDTRSISMSDADFRTLIEEGFASIGKRNGRKIETTGRARTAAEAASNDTVAVRQKKGG